MKAIFTIIATLLISVTFAETVGTINFDLPQGWVAVGQIENEWGITKIFGKANKNSEESFGINVNSKPAEEDELASIKKGLESMAEGEKVDIKQVEKTKDGFIFEWSTKSTFGLGRVFVWKDGSAVLNYMTKNVKDSANQKKVWLPVLKAAKKEA